MIILYNIEVVKNLNCSHLPFTNGPEQDIQLGPLAGQLLQQVEVTLEM